MPIIQPTDSTPPVFYPNKNQAIVKYMDLSKFISLLHKQSLFFCRLDKLEDKFEGTTPRMNFDLRKAMYQNDNFLMNTPLTEEEIIIKVNELYEFEKKLKRINCVNCWNKYVGESAALWKIYSDFNKGIMIKTSVAQLEVSLGKSREEIKLSEIRYIDYNHDTMLDGNTMYPLIHKHQSYSYEQEIRLIYEVNPAIDWDYNWADEEVEEGIYIKSDLRELIEEIVISPYSPKWFFNLIEGLIKKYDLVVPINKSELSIT